MLKGDKTFDLSTLKPQRHPHLRSQTGGMEKVDANSGGFDITISVNILLLLIVILIFLFMLTVLNLRLIYQAGHW